MTLGILKAFVKKLDVIVLGWDPESCYLLKRVWVSKLWLWLGRRLDLGQFLIKEPWLIMLKAVEAVDAKWDSNLSLSWLVDFYFYVLNFFYFKTLTQS